MPADLGERQAHAPGLVDAQGEDLDLEHLGPAARHLADHVADRQRAAVGQHLLDPRAQLDRPEERSRSLNARPTSPRPRPNRDRAWRLASSTSPSLSTTSWATGLVSKAESTRSAPSGGARGRGAVAEARAAARGRGWAAWRTRGVWSPPGEQVGAGHQRLRLAQEQEPAVVQGEVEVVEHAALGLGVEVHQGVPADEEVDPGDGRVLHQVVAAEDHRPSQVLPEHAGAVGGLEEALDQDLAQASDAGLRG